MDKHLLDIDISHPYQLSILDMLRHTEILEYAKLLPDGFSGNEFLYHLKKLVSAGLIVKNGKGYSLSAMGLLVSDSASYESNKMKIRPVVGFWLYVVNVEKKVLLYESKRAPLFGKMCLPYGKLRVGESVEQSLQRMLQKRGLDSDLIDEVEHFAVNVRYFQDGELIAHRYGEVMSCTYTGDDKLTVETKNGKSGFYTPDTDYLEKEFSSTHTPDYTIDA